MNIYRLTNKNGSGYDFWDSCVVIAKSKYKAQFINPQGDIYRPKGDWSVSRAWANYPSGVEVEWIGIAGNDQKENSVVCASFNAG